MKPTTQDIIRMLPIDESIKHNLLENFDTFTEDQKFNLERIIWGFYDTLYEIQLEENIKLALLRAENNQEKLDDQFYRRVHDMTEQQMQSALFNHTTQTDLEDVRKKLEEILQGKTPGQTS